MASTTLVQACSSRRSSRFSMTATSGALVPLPLASGMTRLVIMSPIS